ncbi:hypothetical protein M1K46_15895 [Fictibacillus sp. WQ 8-8]|uniref:hypothetical protein n=1 Tax=Fictibacillus sp. WQ 8-8 TaxID=2938788 RepID=UPI00210D7F7C|nr:hypothetical protein [Fictibacillus sp. WQ 8-8]MCQ6267140.1 hypothetical protein [Fictibacillus sp. WQ 8-8]
MEILHKEQFKMDPRAKDKVAQMTKKQLENRLHEIYLEEYTVFTKHGVNDFTHVGPLESEKRSIQNLIDSKVVYNRFLNTIQASLNHELTGKDLNEFPLGIRKDLEMYLEIKKIKTI